MLENKATSDTDIHQPKKEYPAVALLAGALSGLVGDAIMYPIDTLRTRLQAQRGKCYSNTLDVFKKVTKGEGFSALFKGIGTVSALTIPAHALYFCGYEMSKQTLEPNTSDDRRSNWVHFISGLVADIFGSIIWIPMDIAKQRLQMQNNSVKKVHRHSIDVWMHILRTEGFLGLYRGTFSSLATYGPFVGIYFVIYEQWKNLVSNTRKINRNELSLSVHLVGGFVAGAIAAALTCPLDVVKTNLQVYSKSEGGYSGMISAVKNLYQTEGPKVFLRGLSARILWIAPNTAITIASYEQFKYFILRTFPDWRGHE